MGFFVPDHGISGPEITPDFVCLDHDVEIAFSMAEQIYQDKVTYFLNGFPGFRETTTKEQKAIYVLARALQAYARKV
jgi:hypothetical protein